MTVEAIVDPELSPPFEVLEPEALASPLVCNSPHSGAVYPASFLASARLDAMTLRRSEDAFVDALFRHALKAGAPLMHARFPRAFLDVNREPYELDPRMFDGRLPPFANTRSMRVVAGLGTIARLVGEAQEIYARRLMVPEAMQRIEVLYKPYHRVLRGLVERAGRRYGTAILIDCHSMPSGLGGAAREERVKADFIIGDRFGTSCAGLVTDVVEHALRQRGYSVARNKPYAGGFITEHYGNPAIGRHAVQIEVNRGLYMDETLLRRNKGFERLALDIGEVMKVVANLRADDVNPPIAAAAE